jgi:hypothetical protein
MKVFIRVALAFIFAAGLSAKAVAQPVSVCSGPCDASVRLLLPMLWYHGT